MLYDVLKVYVQLEWALIVIAAYNCFTYRAPSPIPQARVHRG